MNKLSFIKTIILFIGIWFITLLIGGTIVGLIGADTTPKIRIATVIQDVVMFILPAIVTALMITRIPATYLRIDRFSKFKNYLLVILVLIVSIPAMNYIIEWNSTISLPESMNGIEKWAQENESNAADAIKIMLGNPTVPNLIMSILIVGILAGLSEELFFRGALQKILHNAPMNAHIAIWLTAFIFSAVHMQFYGFIPRLLLGAFFGYLVWWSGSLWLPIVAHAFNNMTTVFVTWLYDSGNIEVDPNSFGATSSITDITIATASAIATIFLIIYLRKMLIASNQTFCDEKQSSVRDISL